MSANGKALVQRAISPFLLVLMLMCLALPFVSVGCDEVTYRGAAFVEGDDADFRDEEQEPFGDSSDQALDEEPEMVLSSGAAPITLAVVFASLGALVALLPGLVAATFAYGATAVTAGMLVAFFLSGTLRGEATLFVDFRHGFWLAIGLAVAAALVAWMRWQTHPRATAGAPVVLGFAAVGLLTASALVPWIGLDSAEPVGGLSLAGALSSGVRRSEAWGAVGLVGVPFLALFLTMLLMRQPSRLAAPTALGVGIGWAVYAAAVVGLEVTERTLQVGDGVFLALLGAVALVAAALLARSPAGEFVRLDRDVRVAVLVGSAVAVAGALVPFQSGGEEDAQIALLWGGPNVGRWLAVPALAIALLVGFVGWALPRARAATMLLGLGSVLLFFYLALLRPLSGRQEEDVPKVTIEPGAFIGCAGAGVVLVASAFALWRGRAYATAASPSSDLTSAKKSESALTR